jgi:hypothetical protein
MADGLGTFQIIVTWLLGLLLWSKRVQKNRLTLTSGAWTIVPDRSERYETFVTIIPPKGEGVRTGEADLCGDHGEGFKQKRTIAGLS